MSYSSPFHTTLNDSPAEPSHSNGYLQVLQVTGAKVLAFAMFGLSEGDWLAKVEYHEKTGWIYSHYGACSESDPFEAKFGFSHEDASFQEIEISLAKDFAKRYLNELLSPAGAWKAVTDNHPDWQDEIELMQAFIAHCGTDGDRELRAAMQLSSTSKGKLESL